MVAAPASMIRTPTPVEPVNETMSTLGLVVKAAAGAGFDEVMTLTTPGGKPTACMISASSIIASGSCGAGFMTTVQPTAKAGAILPTIFTRGKL